MKDITSQILKIEEIEKQKLTDVIQTVLAKQLALIIQLPNGDEVVVIQPKPPLKPLPVLEGYTPDEWKEAIY